jgi:hypothetical protein
MSDGSAGSPTLVGHDSIEKILAISKNSQCCHWEFLF